jgi:hypothetical protein
VINAGSVDEGVGKILSTVKLAKHASQLKDLTPIAAQKEYCTSYALFAN